MDIVNALLRRAESILEVAAAPSASGTGTFIVVDRSGSVRMMNSEGWTMTGIIQEFGANEVYLVRKHNGTTTVEGWTPTDRCTISQQEKAKKPAYAAMLQVMPRLLN